MNLTTKGRYAVMAMVDLARNSNGEAVPLSEIALRQNIAVSYLEQIFMKLRRANLVESTRGPGGGYKICGSIDDMSISDIVVAVDESIKITRCNGSVGSLGCLHDKKICLEHDLWKGLSDHIFNYLSNIYLSDVCEGKVRQKLSFTG